MRMEIPDLYDKLMALLDSHAENCEKERNEKIKDPGWMRDPELSHSLSLIEGQQEMVGIIQRWLEEMRKPLKPQRTEMQYKFRAEVYVDVCWLCARLGERLTTIDIERGFMGEPIVLVTLESVALDELRDIMRSIEDGHVMWQTVALAEQYTGERDFYL